MTSASAICREAEKAVVPCRWLSSLTPKTSTSTVLGKLLPLILLAQHKVETTASVAEWPLFLCFRKLQRSASLTQQPMALSRRRA